MADQARTLSHVSNLYGNELGPEVAATIDRLVGGGVEPGRRAGLLRQLGGRGQRVRPQAGPTLGRAGPPRGAVDLGLLPRPDPGHPHGHRPAGQARALRAAPQGSPTSPTTTSGALDGRPRGRADVAGVLVEPIQGEGGVVTPSSDYLAGVRAALHRARGAADGGRDPDRVGPHRARGSPSRASGLRPDVVTMAKALGNGMPVGACWARAEVAAAFGPGRPRVDLRRPAPGAGRRPGHPRRDGGRGRVRAGPAGRRPPGGRPGRVARGGRASGVRGCCWPPSWPSERGPGGGGRRARAGPAGQRGAPRRRPPGAAAAGQRAEIDEALAILGQALAAVGGRPEGGAP